jgi:hypothetical protein
MRTRAISSSRRSLIKIIRRVTAYICYFVHTRLLLSNAIADNQVVASLGRSGYSGGAIFTSMKYGLSIRALCFCKNSSSFLQWLGGRSPVRH